MGKLDGLRERIGDELTNKIISLLSEKEQEALGLGMTPKEVQEEKPAPETEAKEKEAETVDATALAGAFAESVKPLLEPVSAQLTALETATKELETKVSGIEALATRITVLEGALKEAQTTAKEAKDGVLELQGEQPRSQKRGVRASEDEKNVVAKEKEGPSPDPLSAFIGDFILSGTKK